MRTFHTGGVAGGDITQGLPKEFEELFEARKPKGTCNNHRNSRKSKHKRLIKEKKRNYSSRRWRCKNIYNTILVQN